MPHNVMQAPVTRSPGNVPGPSLRVDSVRPGELAAVLDRFPGIEHLSLDCFDTVVWRYTDRPFDVFFAAAQHSAHRALGITARARRTAESTARTLAKFRSGRREVTLAEVYRLAVDQLSAEQVRELSEQELAAECDLCFAHPAAVELLRSAGAKGLPVTIVSDTYFDERQLRRLLAHVLPIDAMSAVGRVVCSSEHGVAKAEGLFEIAYGDESVRRERMLHVGDNVVSDYRAALEAGLQAVHLLQRDGEEIERESMRASALSILDSRVRDKVPLHAPYRGPLSTWQVQGDESALGGGVLGPILHAFARWVGQERRRLEESGKREKFVFLLRDGHLPFLASQAIGGNQDCFVARISRFTAFAASFRSRHDIDDYLARFVWTRRFHVIARQLLLPEEIATKLVARATAAADPVTAFCEGVRSPRIVEAIIASSERFRRRMKRHLERETGMQRGDSIVFVDVGYLGTAQRVLKPVFEQEWGVELRGRYLLAVGTPTEEYRGMVDASWCDERVMDSLVPHLSLVDNLCACPGGSVEDYAEDGHPVLADLLLDQEQIGRVQRLQAECVRFVQHAEAFLRSSGDRVSHEWLREGALGELVRLIYFPTASELRVLSGFQVEVNLGSRESRALFDADAGLERLRLHGPGVDVGHSTIAARYPAGLRAAGLELSLSLFAQQRFALDVSRTNWTCRSDDLDVLLLRGNESARASARALATHDGYFSAIVPVGERDLHVGLVLGRYAWIQVHSATLVPLSRLPGDAEGLEILPLLILDGMRDHGHGVYECIGPGALAMIPSGVNPFEEPVACRFVFRPIARRQ